MSEGFDCTAAPPHLFPMLDSSDFEMCPPDVGAWQLLENASYLANHLPRHRESAPLDAILVKSEQSGTRSGISTYFKVFSCRVYFNKLLILMVPGGGLEPPRPVKVYGF